MTKMASDLSGEFIRRYVELAAEAAAHGLLAPGQRPGELGRPPKPAFQEAGLPWRDVSRWGTVFRGKWAKEEPITWQELRTLGLLGRHLSRVRGAWHQRYLVLMDSLSSIGAFEKGRTGVYPMLIQCRRLCAIGLTTGIRFVLRWTPGKWNYADGPSRGFPCGVAPSTLQEKDLGWNLLEALEP